MDHIKDDYYVTVTEMSHILEIQYLQHVNTRANIRKLDKNRYVLLSGDDCGLVKDFIHTENRAENKNSLAKTFKKLRSLINTNFQAEKNELFITLTYAENMTDTLKLYKDMDIFHKRFKRRYPGYEYISVIEPQARGAWHAHILAKWRNDKYKFIDNRQISEIWGHGITHTDHLDNVDNVGAYVTAYLADIPISESTIENLDVITKSDGKKYIKGGRLYLYPPGMQLYRKSKGIIKPTKRKMKYKDAQNKYRLDQARLAFTKRYEYRNDEFENLIVYEQYNLKRSILKGEHKNA